MNKIYKNTFILIALLFSAITVFSEVVEGDKVPVVIFDFTDDIQGWTTHNLDAHLGVGDFTSWDWRASDYYATPGGVLYITAAQGKVRNTWAVSPEIDLSKTSNAEMYLTYVHKWGTKNANICYIYAQVSDSLNLTLEGDSAYIKQWGDININLDPQVNEGELGIPWAGYEGKEGPYTTSPLNLSMFDGKKIRLGIHFYNLEESSANSRNYAFKSIQVAGNIEDKDPPVIAFNEIDSIGNTFVRGSFSGDEISKVFWAVKPAGSSIASVAEIKSNVGSSDYISSGIVDINAAGKPVLFDIIDLEINTNYTLFFGGEDFQGNIAELQTTNFSSNNDLTAPKISSIEITNIEEVFVTANLLADELGTITYRVYPAGWEPTNLAQFQSGAGSVKGGTLLFDTLNVAEDWLIEYLDLNTEYVLYATVTDLTGNISEIFKSANFKTLADTKAPKITFLSFGNMTNHGGIMKLIADEPSEGFGDAYVYWVATDRTESLTKEGVLAKTGGFASGKALLDSATYENNIEIINLDRNLQFTINVVVIDGSGNVSDVAKVAANTTNELESIPLFIQEFDVENQNYHFVNVNVYEDKEDIWFSEPANSRVMAKSQHTSDREFWQDAWCMVGPINLKNIVDITAELDFRATYGKYNDHVLMYISKSYKPGDVIDINNWTQISEPGDFPNTNTDQLIIKNVPTGFDTTGVYIGIRYYHNVFALTYAFNSLKIFGKSIGETAAPIIDWVEAQGTSATEGQMSFTGDNYGRIFYYLIKDEGSTPAAPTLRKVKGGDGATVSGFFDYTAGNYIDQGFTISGLEPNTKYHLFTGFRDLKYYWAENVYYDAGQTVFTTTNLELTSVADSLIHATGVVGKASASSSGRIFWTVKGATEDAPQNFDQIRYSFDKRGNFNYNIVDGSAIDFSVSGLKPDSAYVYYAVLTDFDLAYESEIKQFNLNTKTLEIITASNEEPVAINDEKTMFSIVLNAQTTTTGKLYLALTKTDNFDTPSVDSLIAGVVGYVNYELTIEDPSNIVIQLDSLTADQTKSYLGWFVLKSDDYVSDVYLLENYLVSAPYVENSFDFNLSTRENSIVVGLSKRPDREVHIYDITGRIVAQRSMEIGNNQVGPFKSGIYLVRIQQDSKVKTKKVIVN